MNFLSKGANKLTRFQRSPNLKGAMEIQENIKNISFHLPIKTGDLKKE